MSSTRSIPPIVFEQTELVGVDTLQEHPNNPRDGDVGAIVTSLQRNGMYRPLVVQRSTNFVLAGNHTLRAARLVMMPQVAVVFADVDDATAARILLVDNRASDLASYRDEELAALLHDLATNNDLLGTGYSPDDVDDLLAVLNRDTKDRNPTTANSGEVDMSNVDLAHRCPRCGFEFDDKRDPTL